MKLQWPVKLGGFVICFSCRNCFTVGSIFIVRSRPSLRFVNYFLQADAEYCAHGYNDLIANTSPDDCCCDDGNEQRDASKNDLYSDPANSNCCILVT